MTGIIAAMQCELQKLLAMAENVSQKEILSITYYTGSLAGEEVVMAVCGEGKVNAAVCAQTMILAFGPDRILNTGVAGSLSPTLHVPNVAIATAAVQHDYDISPLGYEKGLVLCGKKTPENQDGSCTSVFFKADPALSSLLAKATREEGIYSECGVIASGDQFISEGEKKEEIRSLFGAIACEMEGGAIAQVCTVAGVPFGLIRAISDNADEKAPESFDPLRAAEISTKVTIRTLSALAEKG